MIELLVGLAVILYVAWVIAGVVKFAAEIESWYPFKELTWWEWALMAGPVTAVLGVAWVIGAAVVGVASL